MHHQLILTNARMLGNTSSSSSDLICAGIEGEGEVDALQARLWIRGFLLACGCERKEKIKREGRVG